MFFFDRVLNVFQTIKKNFCNRDDVFQKYIKETLINCKLINYFCNRNPQ